MKKPYWSGVFPAVTTQMKRDQSLDLDATGRHLEVLIKSGVNGFVMLGSLGENQTLAASEKKEVLEFTLRLVRGRVPVLSGVAEMSTGECCRYMKEATQIGVDGFMLLPAMVYKGDPLETLTHFRKAARATDLPIMVYNNPISYANDITPEMFARLAEVKNLVAIKESSGNPRRITDLRTVVGDHYALFTGVDDLVLETSILGIDGWVSGAGLACPEENQHFWNLTRLEKWDEARELYRWLTPLFHLDTHIKFVQYIKLAVQEAGLGSEWVRAPRLPLQGAERKQILSIIRNAFDKRPKLRKKNK